MTGGREGGRRGGWKSERRGRCQRAEAADGREESAQYGSRYEHRHRAKRRGSESEGRIAHSHWRGGRVWGATMVPRWVAMVFRGAARCHLPLSVRCRVGYERGSVHTALERRDGRRSELVTGE